MIKVEMKGAKELQAALKKAAKQAIPYAAKSTINNMAFAARAEFNKNLGKSMTLRNSWTTRGTVVEKARGTNVNSMQAVMGSTRDYVAQREEGGTETARGKHGIALPTGGASGQAHGARRTRPVRRSAYLSALKLTHRGGAGNQRQGNAVAIATAVRRGQKHVFLDFGRARGIFAVAKGKRRARLRMLYDLSHRSLTTKPIPTMAETLKHIERIAPDIAVRALEDQCRRHRILGY